MRLDADHQRGPRVRFALALALSIVSGAAACSKTWVLAPDPGAGGAGATIGSAGGAGGSPAPPGSGGLPGFGGRGDSGSGGSHGGGSCKAVPVQSYPLIADMVFVVGRNASMAMSYGNTIRMTAVQTAMHNAISAQQYFVNFGYQGFPSFTGCPDGSMCCASSDDLADVQPGAMSAIDKVSYHPCDPSQSGAGTGCVAATDSRAVSQTLSSVMNRFGSNSDTSTDRYVVLVTDGSPGCPGEDPNKACATAQGVVSTLAMLNHGGIKTFVVDVGEPAPNDPCLDQLAMTGKTGMPTFYAPDPTTLATAFNQITNVAAVTSCTVVVSGGGDPDSLGVFVGGREVHYEAAGINGWNAQPGPSSSLRIQLHGTACNFALNLREPSIQVWSGCPPCAAPSTTCM